MKITFQWKSTTNSRPFKAPELSPAAVRRENSGTEWVQIRRVTVGVVISHDMATEWCYHVDLWHLGAQKIKHGTRFEHSKFRDLSFVYDVFSLNIATWCSRIWNTPHVPWSKVWFSDSQIWDDHRPPILTMAHISHHWLVVWNMNCIFHIFGIITPTD